MDHMRAGHRSVQPSSAPPSTHPDARRRTVARLRARSALLCAAVGSILLSACGEGSTPPPPPDDDVLGVSEQTPTSDSRVATDGLVASYDMTSVTDDGLLRDFSGRGLHGVIEGTDVVETARGGGRAFDAATDRIVLPSAVDFDLDGPLTVAARFRFDVEGQHQHIIACDNKFVLWLTDGDRPRFANTIGDAVEAIDPLSSGEWHVIIGIFRGTAGDVLNESSGEIWIDGVKIPVRYRNSSGTEPVIWQQGTLNQNNACFIGFEAHAGDPVHQNLPFFGSIDEVMVFERALNLAEVAALSASP